MSLSEVSVRVQSGMPSSNTRVWLVQSLRRLLQRANISRGFDAETERLYKNHKAIGQRGVALFAAWWYTFSCVTWTALQLPGQIASGEFGLSNWRIVYLFDTFRVWGLVLLMWLCYAAYRMHPRWMAQYADEAYMVVGVYSSIFGLTSDRLLEMLGSSYQHEIWRAYEFHRGEFSPGWQCYEQSLPPNCSYWSMTKDASDPCRFPPHAPDNTTEGSAPSDPSRLTDSPVVCERSFSFVLGLTIVATMSFLATYCRIASEKYLFVVVSNILVFVAIRLAYPYGLEASGMWWLVEAAMLTVVLVLLHLGNRRTELAMRKGMKPPSTPPTSLPTSATVGRSWRGMKPRPTPPTLLQV